MDNFFFEEVLIRAVDPLDLLCEMKRLAIARADGAPSVDFVMGYAQALCLTRAISSEYLSHMFDWAAEQVKPKDGR